MNFKLLSKGGLNLLAIILLQGTSFLIGIWAAKLMSHSEFGALQFLRTIQGYSAFTTLGVTQAVMYELPIAIGRKDSFEVELIQKFYNSLLIYSGVFAILLMLLLMLAKVPLNGIQVGWAWLLLGIILAISGWTSYSQILFQSYQQFGKLGVYRFIYPIVFSFAVVVLLPEYKINGFLISMIFGYSVLSAYGLFIHRKTLGYYWDSERFWRYVSIGLPIRLSSFVWLLITSLGLWLSSLLISSYAAGIYGFAMLISTAYALIPGVIAEMSVPRISTLYGKNALNRSVLIEPAKQSLMALACINIAPALLSLLVFDIITAYWVPKYQQAMPIMLCLVLGFYLNSICSLASNILNLLNRQRATLIICCVVLVFVTAISLISVAIFGTTAAVAFSAMLGLFLNGALICWLVFKELDLLKDKIFIFKLVTTALLGCCVITVVAISARHFEGIIRYGVFLIGFFCLSSIPVIKGIHCFRLFWQNTAGDQTI